MSADSNNSSTASRTHWTKDLCLKTQRQRLLTAVVNLVTAIGKSNAADQPRTTDSEPAPLDRHYELLKLALETEEKNLLFCMDAKGHWHEVRRVVEIVNGRVQPTSENPSLRFVPRHMCIAVHTKLIPEFWPFQIEVEKRELIRESFHTLLHGGVMTVFYFTNTTTDNVWLKTSPIVTHAAFLTESDAIIGSGCFTVVEQEKSATA